MTHRSITTVHVSPDSVCTSGKITVLENIHRVVGDIIERYDIDSSVAVSGGVQQECRRSWRYGVYGEIPAIGSGNISYLICRITLDGAFVYSLCCTVGCDIYRCGRIACP